MNDFIKSALSAFVGAFVAVAVFSVLTCVFFFLGIIGIVAAAGSASSSDTFKLKNKSVLTIDFNTAVVERVAEDDLDFQKMLSGDFTTNYSLQDLIDVINEAKTNDKIEGIYLKCDGVGIGTATAYTLHKAFESYKESGKWMVSYAPQGGYNTWDYYFSSLSDSIFINPQGGIDIHGFMAQVPYFKNLLDKLGIKVQVFKVGTFKSAVEPYILSGMSDANKEQTQLYLDNMWNCIAGQMADARGLELAKLNSMIDSVLVFQDVNYLLNNKLVDASCYEYEIDEKIKRIIGIEEDEDVNFVSVSQLKSAIKEDKKKADSKIAVLYAVGEINSSSKEGIVAADLIPLILDAEKDDDVKGLVLRVNSPGGSAYDSEQIWAALEKFKTSGKPLAVSMGDYAASGGYYISCGANRIFAEPTTLTGSIGIFGMLPDLSGVADKVGINVDYVSTNKNSIFSLVEPLNPLQSRMLQNSINRGYELFTSRCATGRDMPIDSLKLIAEGRVWDGQEALKLNLVDELGSLKDAIEWVAAKAELGDNYKLSILPEPENWFERFMKEYEKRMVVKVFGVTLDALYDTQRKVKSILEQDPIQAREYIEVGI